MIFLKRLLLIILVLVVIALIVALFVNKDMNISREIVINKPRAEVFNYIKYLKNQNNFSKWARMDPNMKTNFTGTDGTPGFTSSWEGNSDVGKGEQTIDKINDGDGLETTIHFIKPWDSKAQGKMSTQAITDSTTKVTWGFQSQMPYPMNIMKLFMNMDKSIGDDLSTGLANLKSILEK